MRIWRKRDEMPAPLRRCRTRPDARMPLFSLAPQPVPVTRTPRAIIRISSGIIIVVGVSGPG